MIELDSFLLYTGILNIKTQSGLEINYNNKLLFVNFLQMNEENRHGITVMKRKNGKPFTRSAHTTFRYAMQYAQWTEMSSSIKTEIECFDRL